MSIFRTHLPRPRRRAVVGLLAALAMVLALSACTPSGYQAEKAGVAQIHYRLTGVSTSASNVTCDEFVKQGGDFVGGCYARGWGYIVRSTYHAANNDNSATVFAVSPQWGSFQCAVMKTPSGAWATWNESCH